jgi:RHS repeat-associated protein
VYDAAGQVAAEYSTAAPPQVGTLYLTPDHLGSTRLETNDLGAAVAYHDYLPFGEEIPSGLGGRGSLYGAVDGQTHKFTGKERDALETGGSAMQGLDYLTVRYMSSAQGRFTSPDPKHFPHDIADPQSWNKYGYARNNPLRYTDPDGADWQDALKGAINAFTSDNTVGVGRSNVGNGDFRTGQAVGDAVAGVTGTLEALVGSGGEAVGAVLDATGVGALIGVPVNVVSAGIIAHGATTAVEGAGNLANAALSSALGPKEGVSGGPGGGKRVNDQTKRAALEENNAANNGRAKCVFCGDPVGEGAANKINYDHANPKSQNGSGTDVRNVNVTCEYCNKSKGTGSEPKNPKYPDQQ